MLLFQINLRKDYWNLPEAAGSPGVYSKAGMLIGALSVLALGTNYNVQGYDRAKHLAAADSSLAIENAENWAWAARI